MAARVNEVETNVLRVFLKRDGCESPEPWGIAAGVDRLEQKPAVE